MVKLPIGTVVRIKSDLAVGKCYGDVKGGELQVELLDSMSVFLGREATITSDKYAENGVYVLDGLYFWNRQMFELMAPEGGAGREDPDKLAEGGAGAEE